VTVTDSSTDVEEYQRLRPLLFSIAYRMTGSVADAEDIVSEAFLRLHRAHAEGIVIESMKSYLSTVVSRLSISHLRLARVRREHYFGTWLPEPVVAEEGSASDLSDSLSLALLVVLESLTPVERAVFLLHEVFGFEYASIAEVVDKSEVNCRQIAARARRRVNARRPRFEAPFAKRATLAERFFAAVETGDLEGLVDMLAADVVTYGDGGGRGPSLPKPVYGREKVLRLLTALSTALRRFDLHLERATVNAQPGLLVRDASGALLDVLSVDVVGAKVQTIHSILNPDKLGHLGPLAGPDHPLRRNTHRTRHK
jgi:RNA polymerase sigma-70 factor (ECF subfamily)